GATDGTRAGAAVSAVVGNCWLKASTYARAASAERRKAVTCVLLLRSAADGDPVDRWRQDRRQAVLSENDSDRRSTLRPIHRRTQTCRPYTMTGHRPFKALTARFSREQRAHVATRVAELKEEMALAELRRARRRSQVALARVLKVKQPAVAKLEKRTDI